MTTSPYRRQRHPRLSAPDWCRVSKADHIAQLPQVDGSLLHYSTTHSTTGEEGDIFEVFLTRLAYTDGTPDQRDGWPAEMLYVDGQAMTREQAEAHAHHILELAAKARP